MKSIFTCEQLNKCSSKTTKWQKTFGAGLRLSLVSLLVFIFSSNLTAQFTLNGLPEEWPGILNNAGISAKVFVRDANSTDDNQFTTGSQDPNLIATWGWSLGQTNNKGDISNAGAALLPGNILAFFGDRTAINGAAQIGFWFFKSNIHPLGDGLTNSLFTVEHQVGDLLVLSNFTNGGGVVQLRIFRWVGSGGSEGTLDLVGTTSNARVNSTPVAIPSSGPFLASDPNTATWTYQGKNVPSEGVPPPNTYHTGAYFEGFIDLDDINASPCISSFLLETRNSHETNASLQDFVQGGFNGVPDPPTTLGDERCGPGQVNLSSSGCSDGTLKWYDAADNGTIVNEGSSFAPTINSSTTYYVSCTTADGCEGPRSPVTGTINPLPTLSLDKTDVICEAGSNGTVTATFSGGTAPYNIRIDGGSYTVQTSPYTFTGLNATEHTVDVYDANNCADQKKITPGTIPCSCPCITCDGEVVVNQNVTVNFNNNPPTYSGDSDLLPYFSADKTGGTTPDKWKAVFDLGANKLVVNNNATITVSQVNGYAPGIEILTTCEVVVEESAAIKVISNNRNAGDIVITASGTVTVNGEIRNQVTGTLGLPGAINGTSTCGNIDVSGLIQILGTDGGGKTITLVTCISDCTPPPFSGDITISGLVKSFAAAHAGDLTLNRPNIRVVSLNGGVVINANTADPLYDEFSVGGGLYDIYGGLLSWVSANVNPGTITVQALKDVVVYGHGIDPTGPVRKSFGAIAAIATASSAPGGVIDVRSLEGKIIGNDRAFDVSGRNRLTTNFAHILLNAKDNIELNRLGANNSFNPVVNASGFGTGDKGGLNDLRSYSGSISIGTNALVTAAVPSGTQGVNNLTSCTGVTNNGTINPLSAFVNDCDPAAPDALYTNCPDIDEVGSAFRAITITPKPILSNPEKTVLLPNYPNPFRHSTTISYALAKPGFVTLKVFNIVGKEVATIVSQDQAAGEHRYQWNSASFPSGVYYARLKAGEFLGINKLVLTK